jgi:hypothetical protein
MAGLRSDISGLKVWAADIGVALFSALSAIPFFGH